MLDLLHLFLVMILYHIDGRFVLLIEGLLLVSYLLPLHVSDLLPHLLLGLPLLLP